eukprot:2588793-Pyramimonas_sp.AAC.1
MLRIARNRTLLDCSFLVESSLQVSTRSEGRGVWGGRGSHWDLRKDAQRFGLAHLDDGRQHPLAVVSAEISVDGRQRSGHRPRENTEADVYLWNDKRRNKTALSASLHDSETQEDLVFLKPLDPAPRRGAKQAVNRITPKKALQPKTCKQTSDYLSIT